MGVQFLLRDVQEKRERKAWAYISNYVGKMICFQRIESLHCCEEENDNRDESMIMQNTASNSSYPGLCQIRVPVIVDPF